MQHLHTGYCKDTELATDAFKSLETRPPFLLPGALLYEPIKGWRGATSSMASLERNEERKPTEKKEKKREKRKKKTNKKTLKQPHNDPQWKGVACFVLWFLTEGKAGRAPQGWDASMVPMGGSKGGSAPQNPPPGSHHAMQRNQKRLFLGCVVCS